MWDSGLIEPTCSDRLRGQRGARHWAHHLCPRPRGDGQPKGHGDGLVGLTINGEVEVGPIVGMDVDGWKASFISQEIRCSYNWREAIHSGSASYLKVLSSSSSFTSLRSITNLGLGRTWETKAGDTQRAAARSAPLSYRTKPAACDGISSSTIKVRSR